MFRPVMIRAYEEIIDFIVAGTTPATVARFEPSQETKEYVAGLFEKEKTIGCSFGSANCNP